MIKFEQLKNGQKFKFVNNPDFDDPRWKELICIKKVYEDFGAEVLNKEIMPDPEDYQINMDYLYNIDIEPIEELVNECVCKSLLFGHEYGCIYYGNHL